MAAIKLILKTDGPHVINDLGLTIEGVAGTIYDLTDERASDVSQSADLLAAVDAGSILVLDPRDANELIELGALNSKEVLTNHNQVHWGVVGGRFANLDDPNTTQIQDNVVVFGSGGASAVATPLSTLLGTTANTEALQDIVGTMFNGEADITYNDASGDFTLEDNFLRNTGDTLDSGTLSVVSGAIIDIEAGGSLTIQDAPTAAKDAANKEYVDAIANGLDHKESVQVGSTAETGFLYANNGGVGDTLTDGAVAGTTTIDGIVLSEGDRVLIKDQTDPKENGIYVVSGADGASVTVLTRSEDQDGSPASEVSAGNVTYVEAGTTNGSTGWIVTGTGDLALNTDNIVWTQNSGQGTYNAAEGLALTGVDFSLITTNISVAAGTVQTTDVIIIGDASDSESTAKTTVGDILNDLDVVSGITGEGFAVRTAADTYTNRVIAVDPQGNLGGLVITDGNGVAGDPTIGLDINNTVSNDGVAATDKVMVYDVSAGENRTYTIQEIASSSSSDSFKTWTASGNKTGDLSIVAIGGVDEVTITGGAGINLDLNAVGQAVVYSLVSDGITASTGVVGTDEIVVFDATSGLPEVRSVTDFISDFDLVTSVVASTAAAKQGIIVDSTNLQAPEVGLDINGLGVSADDMVATDELAMFDGTNNVSVSGQQVADGVADILNLPAITMSAINGQQVATIPDTTRANKVLSIDSNSFLWSENSLNTNDWIEIGSAGDADSGYVMPLDGTITMATAHCENAVNASTINIYNGASTVTVGAAGSFTASANAQFFTTTLNIDFVQGDRIRLRNVGGSINDTVVSLFVKWRA